MPVSIQDTSNSPDMYSPTHVIPKSPQSCSCDILSPSLDLLECSKGLIFSLQEVNGLKVRDVIDECDPI